MATSNIFINKKIWRNYTDIELDKYTDQVVDHYNNFPYYPTSTPYRQNEYHKLTNYQGKILNGGILKQTMHGLALAWSYHPHAFNVPCNDRLTPLQAFTDRAMFRRVIQKRIKIGDNMSDAGVRKMLKIFTGVQGVANFRPTVAKAIYNEFCDGGVTWDISTGFGGRLLGYQISNAKYYIGTDPSTLSHIGNTNLAEDFITDYELHKIGAENYLPDRHSLDLVFSSPPYFNTERYSNEPTQSYIKYPTLDAWFDDFMYTTLSNARYGLKYNGRLIINIADTRNVPDMTTRFLTTATNAGFALDHTLKLTLSSLSSKRKFKCEPVFVLSPR